MAVDFSMPVLIVDDYGEWEGARLAVDEFLGRVSVFGGFWIMQKTGDDYRTVDLSCWRTRSRMF